MSSSKESLNMALWAASRGWAVVPIVPGGKKPVRGHHWAPGRGMWGTPGYLDPKDVAANWPRSECSVAVLTGPSKLVDDDLDVDGEGNPAGDWNLEELADGRELPRTFTLATPSGGTHLVWANMNGRQFKTGEGSHNKPGPHDIIPGAPYIDVRGRGGLFVLWSPDGKRIITDDRPPVPIPQWLADMHPEPGTVPGGMRVANINVSKWLDKYGGGDICPVVDHTLQVNLDLLDEITPHNAMTNGVYALVGDRVGGHTGLNLALGELRSKFDKVMKGKTREREKREEWANAVAGAIRRKLTASRKRVGDHDPCHDFDTMDADDPVKIARASKLLAGLRNGAWLNKQKFPPIHFAVPELLPEGLVLLSGAPKVGKSTIIKRIGLEVARGGHVFGIRCEQIPSLYMALEDEDSSMQRDSDSLLGERGNVPDDFWYITEIVPGKLIDTVAAWLDTTGTGLVVVDTLGRAMEPAKRGETTYERDYRIMTMLKSICKKHPGATIVVSHHSRKGKSEDWLDTVSGTNAISGAADTIVSLTRNRNETSGIWRATSRKPMDDAEYALTLERPYGWRLDGEDLLEAAGNAVKDTNPKLGDRSVELIEFVEDNPTGVRAADVAKELGITPKDAGTYLNNALKRGDIKKLSLGLYGPWGKSTSKKGSSSDDDD